MPQKWPVARFFAPHLDVDRGVAVAHHVGVVIIEKVAHQGIGVLDDRVVRNTVHGRERLGVQVVRVEVIFNGIG